ncbi:hypothetical protein LV469_03045 [Peptoniphilus sp. GNH]|nr:hypothetical protein LV469_03045 [Peptoniphilus sp. GNH]
MNELMTLIESVDIESVGGVLQKVSKFQETLQRVLVEGHDYGEIPGTNKPTLLKPGAEKILMLLGLTSEYEIVDQVEDWKAGVFAYTVRCILSKGGMKITEGLGQCNSKEDKYRYRWVREDDIPLGQDLGSLKQNRYGKYRIDNDEVYSLVNTILKMAKKRAQVDAALTAASLSDIFTQDVEDIKEFRQQESVATMNLDDAARIKLNFGKYTGKSLGDIAKVDIGYIEWLASNARDARTKKAADMLYNGQDVAVKDVKEDKMAQEEEDIYRDIPEGELPF